MSACKFSGQVLVPLSQLLGCGVRAPMFKNDQTQRSPNLIISMQLATGHDSHSWWVSIGVLSRSLSRPCAQDLGGKPAVAWTAADERLEVLLHGACLITGHFCQILYISINLYIYTRTYIYIYICSQVERVDAVPGELRTKDGAMVRWFPLDAASMMVPRHGHLKLGSLEMLRNIMKHQPS